MVVRRPRCVAPPPPPPSAAWAAVDEAVDDLVMDDDATFFTAPSLWNVLMRRAPMPDLRRPPCFCGCECCRPLLSPGKARTEVESLLHNAVGDAAGDTAGWAMWKLLSRRLRLCSNGCGVPESVIFV